MSYAIDFGTTNTVITRWNAVTQQAEMVALPGLSQGWGPNPALIPSLVFVEDAAQGKVWAGQAVLDRGGDRRPNPRFFRNFKRGIGASIQGFLPELEGQTISFEKVGQWFLGQLLSTLQANEGQALEELIVTVPVDSFEAYRHWLGSLCQDWGIAQIRLLDEPTAAALGYDQGQANVILVIDFGGGTVDFSLVQLRKPARPAPRQGFILKWGSRSTESAVKGQKELAKILAKAGANLGGSDIDNWLIADFAQKLGIPSSVVTQRLAERLKISLSQAPTATEVYFDDRSLESYELTLTRSGLEEILQRHQFFERLDTLLTQVLQQGQSQDISPEAIEAVLLVGGTSQIPAIQAWLQDYFPANKIASDRPFEAIALGALKLVQGQEIQDLLYHSYGVRYWNRRQNCHSWHPIIEAGQAYPMAQPVELTLGASLDNQPSIELIIGELGATVGGTEIYLEGDRLVTRPLTTEQFVVQALNDRPGARAIAQLSPPGYPGSDRIKVLFWVDAQRYLRITVEDLLLQKTLMSNQSVAQLS
ncbi:Hsp70 family protein [Synechocystis sp. LKSZ1]|uniref:Hsp70 family protein n=1 Tax=Synechocystis sp. LKSZ1 TaxID=3144951 RepID=UPI00336BC9F5